MSFDLNPGAGVDLWNRTATTVALSTTAAQSAALSEGIYAVWSTAECYLRVTDAAAGVTTANGYPLRASTTERLQVRQGHRIEGIVAASTATLSYHKVG